MAGEGGRGSSRSATIEPSLRTIAIRSGREFRVPVGIAEWPRARSAADADVRSCGADLGPVPDPSSAQRPPPVTIVASTWVQRSPAAEAAMRSHDIGKQLIHARHLRGTAPLHVTAHPLPSWQRDVGGAGRNPPPTRGMSRAEEGQEVRVDDLRMGRAHAVGKALVDLERRRS